MVLTWRAASAIFVELSLLSSFLARLGLGVASRRFVRFEDYQTVTVGASGLSRTSPVARFTTLPIEQPVFHGEGAQSQVVQEPFQIRHTPPR